MSSSRHPLLHAVRPIADEIGATVVSISKVQDGDLPLYWEGELVGAMRLPKLSVALDRVIATVEREMGASLGDLTRVQKQQAVRLLEEHGAFTLRKSIEDVADAMGVSRITIYNYLNALRGAEDH